MQKVITIARRELLAHLRKPGFYLTTLGVPLIFALVLAFANKATNNQVGLNTVIGDAEEQPHFGYVDQSGTIKRVPTSFPTGMVSAYLSAEQGQAALRAGTITTLYVLPPEYRQSGKVLQYSDSTALGGGSTLGRFRVLLLANLLPSQDPAFAERLEAPMTLKTVVLDPERPQEVATEQDELKTLLLPMGLGVLLTMSIFMSSGLLLQAVIEEKESRTIEVLLSSTRPHKLLLGKVLGLGLLGLIQIVTWLVLARLLLGPAAPVVSTLGAIDIPARVWPLALAYFLLGYLLFATLMAGIGAVSPSMRESSQLTVLIMLPAALPLMLLQVLVADPEGGLAVFMSLFPLTSPISMLMRVASGSVPLWQLGLSLALLALAIVGTIWLAGRLFRASTLLAGKRLSLREMARALRG
jgi:ABC-2 type transport system permease protein